MTTPKFPDVTVNLVGEDGNVFNIIGIVSKEMRLAGHVAEAAAFRLSALKCNSYDEVLQLVSRTVEVA